MNKTELINAMAEKTGLTKKESEVALKAFIETVTESLSKKEPVQLIGFGSFDVAHRPAREGRNPKTNEPMTIAATNAVKFKAGAALKQAVNNG